jgi:hypothetical protein
MHPLDGGLGRTHAFQRGVPLISRASLSRTSPARHARLLGRAGLALAIAAIAVGERRARADAKQACATAADTGQTARDQGRNRAAREAFATCARETCPKIIAQACSTWLRDLDAATPTIVLGAKDETGADLTDVRVSIDGAPLTSHLDGKPLPIDPGAHTLRFEHAGATPVGARVVARTGEKNRLVVIAFRTGAEVDSRATRTGTGTGTAATSDTPPTTDGAAPEPAPAQTRETSSSSSGGRIAGGVTLLAIGAGAAAAGVYFLVQSASASSNAGALRTGIPSDACTNASSAMCATLSNDVDTQHRDTVVGELLVGGAGAFVLAGAATLLFNPRPRARAVTTPPETEHALSLAPSFVRGGGTLTVRGAF